MAANQHEQSEYDQFMKLVVQYGVTMLAAAGAVSDSTRIARTREAARLLDEITRRTHRLFVELGHDV